MTRRQTAQKNEPGTNFVFRASPFQDLIQKTENQPLAGMDC